MRRPRGLLFNKPAPKAAKVESTADATCPLQHARFYYTGLEIDKSTLPVHPSHVNHSDLRSSNTRPRVVNRMHRQLFPWGELVLDVVPSPEMVQLYHLGVSDDD